jgi:hypothetical protein
MLSLKTQTILLRNPCYVPSNAKETCIKTTVENSGGQRYALVHSPVPPSLHLLKTSDPQTSSLILGRCSDSQHNRQMYSQPLTRPIYLTVCAMTLSPSSHPNNLCPGSVYSIPKVFSRAYKSSATEALLAERGRTDSSHQTIDATLEYASSDLWVNCNRL